MKKQIEKRKIPIKKNKKTARQKSMLVYLSNPKRPITRHLKIVKHHYTGKPIPHRHTSYLMLIILLIVVGLFLHFGKKLCDRQAVLGSSTVVVTAIVPSEVFDDNQSDSSGTSANTTPAKTPIIVKGTSPVIDNNLTKDYKFWFDITLPAYYAIFALTLGFWAGDLFNQKFGLKNNSLKKR